MLRLKLIIYFISFFIVIHFTLHFFDIDIFEFFEKKNINKNSDINQYSPTIISNNNEIMDTISDLEKSIQELKDVSSI